MKKIIEVVDLVKKYKKANSNAVDGVSFDVHEGEFFTLLGPNGAGKTTTISILNTTLRKTSGSVTVAGFEVDKNQHEVRKRIGVIFQKPSLDLNLTAEENVRFHASLYGLYPMSPTYGLMSEGYKKRVSELCEVLGLGKEIFAPVKSFSGGMMRKLEIVRGLIHNPKVLFLDEPTTGLDPLSRKNLWEYLDGVRRNEGMTIFLTTHYLEEAEDADNLCVVDHGKVVASGTVAALKKKLVKTELVIDSKERDKLVKQVANLKLPFETNSHVRIKLPRSTSAQKVLQKLDVELSYLRLNSPTLEEAYLKLIEKNEQP
jgi:ABC-2 type transport system ATP-binding protein